MMRQLTKKLSKLGDSRAETGFERAMSGVLGTLGAKKLTRLGTRRGRVERGMSRAMSGVLETLGAEKILGLGRRRRAEKGLSLAMLAALGTLAAVGVFLLYREMPALRRYLRIERM